MKRMILAVAAASLLAFPAFADEKPTDEEAAKVKEAIAAWGCEGGTYEKETEATGMFEVDDAKCGDKGQYDFKLTKDYKVMVITQD